MSTLNIMALFCEDIRDEANGVVTLVGILPDHINVANPPDRDGNAPPPDPAGPHKNLSRFSVYARIGFDPDYDLGEPVFTLKMPHGEILALGRVTADVVEKAKREARERGNPLAGIVFRVAFGTFPLKKLGVAKLEVKIGKRTILAGALNFSAEKKEATSSSAH